MKKLNSKNKEPEMKRGAFRIGPDVHAINSVRFTVDRYGALSDETQKELCAWFDARGYKYNTFIEDMANRFDDGEARPHLTIKVQHGIIESYYDNEKDARVQIDYFKEKYGTPEGCIKIKSSSL